jgi:murein DD-endopeptidase MepM/ murein hydrolase activator NlpD
VRAAALLALALAGCGGPVAPCEEGGDCLEIEGPGASVTGAPALAPSPLFEPPVPRPEAISSTFGPRWKTSASRDDFHPGIDWYDAEGTPLTAIGAGTVLAVHPDGSASFPNGGNVLAISHALPTPIAFHGSAFDRIFAVYLHLAGFAVAEGEAVEPGQVVGTMGATGDTDFVHLHFEIRVGTLCSLPYQTAHPDASCVTGFDPHVHPFLFVGGRDEDAISVEEIPPAEGHTFAVRYRAGRGDLDLDVIETDLGTLGFVERRGIDATSLARLDDFHYPWLTLVPQPFTSSDEELVHELHFPVRPRFLELRDLDGSGVRYGSRP